MFSDKVSLKAFWEAVEGRLAACSADELRDILRSMAQETPPAQRSIFLEKLKRVEGTTTAARQAVPQEDLLADIEDLIQEINASMGEAETWEERHGWDEYDDEDSLGYFEEYVQPLAELFDQAEAAFDYGNPTLARAAYQKLFEIFALEDDYGRGIGISDLTGVDAGETCARYLRAVYQTEPSARRPQAMFEHMQGVRSWLMGSRPMLNDLIQISPRPLPDREPFLADWIAYLRTQSGSDADAWLREAIQLSQGTRGLEALARAEGEAHPRAYLDWITALEREGKHREALKAAQEALQGLQTKLPIRAAIADHLCAAATRLNETEVLRAGRWEAFLAKPTLSRLLDLWDVVPAGTERTTLLRQAVEHVRDYIAHPPSRQDEVGWGGDDLERAAWIDKSVLAHACLLVEDLEAARQLVSGEQVLGWSSSRNPQGLVASTLMALLCGRSPGGLPPNLAQLWQETLQNSAGFGASVGQDPVHKRLEPIYAELLARVSLRDDQQEGFLNWCLDVAQRRVNAIVGGQHRKSYDKAAVLTAACAEVLRLRGDKAAAGSLVDEIRDRFPRHRNFQAEFGEAIRRMERGSR